MRVQGRVWKFGDSVDTDVIYPSRYLVTFDPAEVATHVMEGIDPQFVKRLAQGDLIVAGENFGCGSAREQAAMALKYAGVGAILADSFSRTFFRNAINLALPVLPLKGISRAVEAGQHLEADLRSGRIHNRTTGQTLQAQPLPEFILQMLEKGGAIPYYKSTYLKQEG